MLTDFVLNHVDHCDPPFKPTHVFETIKLRPQSLTNNLIGNIIQERGFFFNILVYLLFYSLGSIILSVGSYVGVSCAWPSPSCGGGIVLALSLQRFKRVSKCLTHLSRVMSAPVIRLCSFFSSCSVCQYLSSWLLLSSEAIFANIFLLKVSKVPF